MDSDEGSPAEALVKLTIQEVSTECSSEVEADIAFLCTSNLINSELKQKLVNLTHSLPQCKIISNTTIPIYNLTQEKTVKKPLVPPLLEIKIGSKKPFSSSKLNLYSGRKTCFVRSIVLCQG